MAATYIKLYNKNPDQRKLDSIVSTLRSGGLIIYPTDTIYGIGCDIFNQKAVENLCRFKNIKPDRHKFSFICSDLSNISKYVKRLDNFQFKILKKTLPGPFTFLLEASSVVPKILKQSKKKMVGIRIPDSNITRQIVNSLGNPIITTSIHSEDEVIDYMTDPEEIYDRYKNQVDVVIDGGHGNNIASAIISFEGNEMIVVREGPKDIDNFL